MSTNLKLLCSHKSLDIRLKFSLCNMVSGGGATVGLQYPAAAGKKTKPFNNNKENHYDVELIHSGPLTRVRYSQPIRML